MGTWTNISSVFSHVRYQFLVLTIFNEKFYTWVDTADPKRMAWGRKPPSAMLTLVEYGTLWIISLYKAVFNCTVIVYLYSALYSCTLFLDEHISAEEQGFWLLHGSPHTEICAISIEQRALELVWGGEVMFFSPLRSLSYGMWTRRGKGGHPWCHCMFVHTHVRLCLCWWVHSWYEEDANGLVYRIKGLEPCGWTLSAMIPFNRDRKRQAFVCLFVSDGGGRWWAHLSFFVLPEIRQLRELSPDNPEWAKEWGRVFMHASVSVCVCVCFQILLWESLANRP